VEGKEDAALKRLDHNVATLISEFRSIKAINFVWFSSSIIILHLMLISLVDKTKLRTLP
jgi:hypothetical protein